MWALRQRDRGDCKQLRETLEESGGLDGLPSALADHVAKCASCAAELEEFRQSRALLRGLPRESDIARPWFAPRVMAAIAAREAELRQSIDAWAVVPKLASRLTWVSALALVVTSTWLIARPTSTPAQPVVTDLVGEPVTESAPLPVSNDEVLLNLTESSL
jgi:hypothetical protein